MKRSNEDVRYLRLRKKKMNFPITQFTREQKGKTVKYVRAYLAEEKEEEGRRLADQLSRRRRGREYRRDRVRLRKLILGARDALKTQRFRLGFLFIIIFFPLLAVSSPCPGRVRLLKKKKERTRVQPCPRRMRTTRERQANGRVRAFLDLAAAVAVAVCVFLCLT